MWEDGKAGDYMLTTGGKDYPDQNMVWEEDNNGLNVRTIKCSRWRETRRTISPAKKYKKFRKIILGKSFHQKARKY